MNLLKTAHKKVILTFLSAIFIPSIIIGYLSFIVFSKHRQSVKRLLQSTLWISSENALETIENALFKYEKQVLRSDNFHYLILDIKSDAFQNNWVSLSRKYMGKLFIMDTNLKIISPQTGREQSLAYPHIKKMPGNYYQEQIQRAEFFEFVEKNHSQAIIRYKKCQLAAVSPHQQSKALEGLGRCLIASKRYEEALEIYHQLSSQFEYFYNQARHPYGIVAVLQMYELLQRKQEMGEGLKLLLELYENIRNGKWRLNPASYYFFTTEIESIFNRVQNLETSLYILNSLKDLQQKQAVYERVLKFKGLLERRIAPRIKEKLDLTPIEDESNIGRVFAMDDEKPYLVSYTFLPNFKDGRTFWGGFYWNLDSIKHKIIPKVLDSLMQESEFHFKTLDISDSNLNIEKGGMVSEGTFAISYRQFPLPWKLLVTHTGIQDFKKTALWESFFYGALFTFLTLLMIFGVILIIRDIYRESETNLLRTEFINNISHELKTPLTLIRLFSETLQRKKNLTKREIKDSSEIITKESERLTHMINNVLDFSRIEMGKKEFNFTQGNLSKVVEETLESYRYHLGKKGFVIRTEIASVLPDMIIDEEAMASVLINLLSNAIKFSPDEKEVVIRLFRTDRTIVLQVADKGIGILKSEIPKIFQRFYRSKNSSDLDSKGSGLGLALVGHITEAHNGWIQVESELGKGSVFSIYLPVSKLQGGLTK